MIIKITKALGAGVIWGVAGIPFEILGLVMVPVAYL